MASVNKVILLGTLGRDPEVRFSANQLPIASLSLATSSFRRSAESPVSYTHLRAHETL